MSEHQSSFDAIKLSQLSIGLFYQKQSRAAETACQENVHFQDALTLRDWQAYYKIHCDSIEAHNLLNESTKASLLCDLYQSLSDEHIAPEASKVPWHKQALFYWLVGAGSLLAITEGIDGMASMLSVLPSCSPIWLVMGGGLFSILSLSVFYGFDMVSISQNLGMASNKKPDLLDQYILQIETIEQITNHWLLHLHEINDLSLLLEIDHIREAFKDQLMTFRQVGENYESALNHVGLYCLKKAFSVLTALFYFSGGFFGGQTLAMTMLAMSGLTVTALSTPVLFSSVFLGVAAMSIFWFFERSGVENLVGQKVGLDQDKIEQLSSKATIDCIESQLDLLKAKSKNQSELIQFRLQNIKTCDKNHNKTSSLGIFACQSSNDDAVDANEHANVKDQAPALQMG